ncbi:calmodulin-binding transcription activator 2 isoform X2 [Struthio camelus]|uniref:calmodulin-binding transcription activator 2 isoform X2 n=1 Tax=Struthio camelus TaxID=8801 RepID=UPI003603F894
MSHKETAELSDRNHLKVFLPRKLVECLPKCPALPAERLRWNTNEEIASYLITFEKHDEWLSCAPKTRPQNGSIILYNRKKVKYRKDGYCWKKRKDGKTTREDHMKLKVQGVECLYGCYVHSSIVPTFHRRCYWLLQNPDIVLVHYLNVPAMEECGKACGPVLCSISPDRKEWLKWSQEELVSQLRPMFHGIKWTCSNGSGAGAFSLEQVVQHVLESQQARPAPRTHACLCSDGLGAPGHKCSSTKHRIISPKVEPGAREAEAAGAAKPEPPKPPSSPDTTQPSPGLALPADGPAAVTFASGLPVLVMASLGGGSGAPPPPPPPPPPPEKPLGLTPSQHLVAGDGGGGGPELAPAPPGAVGLALVLSPGLEAGLEPGPAASAFDPDCFLNSPEQGQTYGCEAEGAGAASPPPPPPYPLYSAPPGRFPLPEAGEPGRAKDKDETPMETAAGAARAAAAAAAEPAAPRGQPDLPEELYSVIQTAGAAGAAELPFGLSFDSLISELLTDEGGYERPGAPSPAAGPAQPDAGPPPAPPPQSPGAAAADAAADAAGLVSITDFSPEWSYPEGGVKVLITGPWSAGAGAYSCLFDRVSVPAALIQPGVLRCYCPPHEAGLAALRVAVAARLLSAPAPFEYRARSFLALPSSQVDWLSLDDNQFRMSILERLEQMEKRLAEMAAGAQAPRGAPGDPPPGQRPGGAFEQRVVAVCEALMGRPGRAGSGALGRAGPFRGMTLLHLAAAQGYAGLVDTLRRWRTLAAESLELEQEVDPLNVDHFSCTPLMWACALGHLEAAVRLFRWDRRALAVPDTLGRLPLSVARARGHLALATRLEELQRRRRPPRRPPPAPAGPRAPSPLAPSPDTGLSTASSISSPSELSDGSGSGSGSGWGWGSLSSAYSSASAARDSPAPSPEGPMELGGPPPAPPSPPGDGPDCPQVDMVTLARQIIEATPERIKHEAFGAAEAPGRERPAPGGLSAAMAWLATYLESVDRPPGAPQHRPEAPPGEPGLERPPPPPSAAGWAEFLNASASGKMESDFALLTLSDHEQHELYEAARVIQTAFRKYKGRRLKEQQEMAAAVIQRCYRKYKQYALYKKMTAAAILIQSKFRSYSEQKKFQRSRRAAVRIQQCYRSHRECERLKQGPRAPPAALPPRAKGTFLTKKQDQAARKIMRFLRRCRHRMKELKQSKEVESLQKRGLAS